MANLKEIKIGVYVQKTCERDKEKGHKKDKDKDKQVEFLDKEAHQNFVENMFSLLCQAS